MDIDKMVKSMLANFLAISTSICIVNANALAAEPTEKCYGIVKAGMNDCKTATASCAGSATKDRQADAFLLLPQGMCDKIVGGNLKPSSEEKK